MEISVSRGVFRVGLLVLAVATCGHSPVFASAPPEITFVPRAPDAPPLRRLYADPLPPPDAPSAQLIEVAGIQDDSRTALTLATKARDASLRAYGVDDARLSIPLINLATARLRTGDTRGALRDFRSVIQRMVDEPAPPRDKRFAEAFYGLGAAQYAVGNFGDASDSFENGLQLHRTQYGLASEGQLDFLRALVATSEKLDLRDANRWQDRRVEVAEKVLESQPESLAWNYLSAGRWYRDADRWDDAIALHARSVAVIEAAYGEQSPKMVGPLLELAISGALRPLARDQRPLMVGLQPNASLRRARAIASTAAAAGEMQGIELLERVGDLYWLLRQRRDGLAVYREAASLRDAGLARAEFLAFDPPVSPMLAGHRGHLLAEFDVDTAGRAREVEIVEVSADFIAEWLAPRLEKSLRAARLRPAMENGEPVRTKVRYRLVLDPRAAAPNWYATTSAVSPDAGGDRPSLAENLPMPAVLEDR